MKKIKLTCIGLLTLIGGTYTFAQEQEKKEEGYKFETVYDLDATTVKNQYRSGTCWSFSGLSFLESEALEKGKRSIGFIRDVCS